MCQNGKVHFVEEPRAKRGERARGLLQKRKRRNTDGSWRTPRANGIKAPFFSLTACKAEVCSNTGGRHRPRHGACSVESALEDLFTMAMPNSQALAPRPARDEWGVYDPQQAGLEALFARLDAKASANAPAPAPATEPLPAPLRPSLRDAQ